jgi:GNAT superfamily N-acetyltransferase
VITFHWEPLSHLLNSGIDRLGKQSWGECGNDKHVFNYDPDWARYGRMEANDILRFVAVREKEDLIGYASVIITDNLHDRKVACGIVQDVFVLPDKRKGGTAGKLMDFIESSLSGIGIQHLTVGERLKSGKGVGRWLAQRGYFCNEHLWTKALKKGSIH